MNENALISTTIPPKCARWFYCSVSLSRWYMNLGAYCIETPDMAYLPSWWRHQMETFSAQLALCAGNSSVPVNSPHKGQWRGALMFFSICVWINGWVNNRKAGDLRRHRGHYGVNVMYQVPCVPNISPNVLFERRYIRCGSICIYTDVYPRQPIWKNRVIHKKYKF